MFQIGSRTNCFDGYVSTLRGRCDRRGCTPRLPARWSSALTRHEVPRPSGLHLRRSALSWL